MKPPAVAHELAVTRIDREDLDRVARDDGECAMTADFPLARAAQRPNPQPRDLLLRKPIRPVRGRALANLAIGIDKLKHQVRHQRILVTMMKSRSAPCATLAKSLKKG